MRAHRVAISVTLLSIALTACTSGDSTPRPTQQGRASSSPIVAGEIRVAYPWEPPTLNPFVTTGDAPAVRELVAPLLPPLFRTLPGGRIEPWLVSKVESETPTEVRVSLRDDATWSNGSPITSTDVAFTWRTIMDKRWPIASRYGYDAISAIDDSIPKQVVLKFRGPVPNWRMLFSGGLGVLPHYALKDADFSKSLAQSWPASGGPYILTHYTRGLELIFEASPQAWGIAPAVKRIRVQFVPDPTTAMQLFKAGKVDVLGPYSSGDFSRRAASLPSSKVTTDSGATWVGILLNAKTGVVSDERVRRAITLALDRDALVAGLVREEGDRLYAPFARPAVEATPPPVDLPAAARLLDQAGYSQRRNGVRRKGSTELAISLASVGSDELSARLVRGIYYRLRDAGFDLNLVELEYEQLWRDWLPSGRMQAAVVRLSDPEQGRAPIADVIPLYRVTASATASAKVQGVVANASADGFLSGAAEWRLAA